MVIFCGVNDINVSLTYNMVVGIVYKKKETKFFIGFHNMPFDEEGKTFFMFRYKPI